MYLHLGRGTVVRSATVVGVFDLDTASIAARTREFLRRAEEAGQVVSVSDEIPKSFVVCRERGRTTVYLSQLAPTTLQKRGGQALSLRGE